MIKNLVVYFLNHTVVLSCVMLYVLLIRWISPPFSKLTSVHSYVLYRLIFRLFILLFAPMEGGYVFISVCLSVCLSACLSTRLLKKL